MLTYHSQVDVDGCGLAVFRMLCPHPKRYVKESELSRASSGELHRMLDEHSGRKWEMFKTNGAMIDIQLPTLGALLLKPEKLELGHWVAIEYGWIYDPGTKIAEVCDYHLRYWPVRRILTSVSCQPPQPGASLHQRDF